MKTLINKTNSIQIVFPDTIKVCVGERYYIIDKYDMSIAYQKGDVYFDKYKWELCTDE